MALIGAIEAAMRVMMRESIDTACALAPST